MRVSACIIAKNESENIKTCIESCKRIAKEVILVDTGSEDDTVKLAQELGAKTYFFAWQDDFAAAKNFAIEKAHGDWIFFPDADEYILEDTAAMLRKEMKRYEKDPKIDALTGFLYNIDSKTQEVRKSAAITRIFKNDPRIRYRGRIHEKIVRADRPMAHRILDKARVYHTGYSAHILPQKNERNLHMLLQAEKDGQADASNYYHIAGVLHSLERDEEALRYIEKLEHHEDYLFLVSHFSLMPNFFIIKTLVLMRLAEMGGPYTYEDMWAVVQEGTQHYPQSCELAEQKINVLLYGGRMDEALEEYQKVIALFNEAEERTGFSHKRDRSRLLCGMARLCWLKGDESAAFDYFVQALSEDYTFKAGLFGLLELIKSQPTQEVIAFLNRVYNETVPEQAGFLAFAAGNIALPEVFFHYFSKLPKEDTPRYQRYTLYQRLFEADYQGASRLAGELALGESAPDKLKELRVLRQCADFLKQESFCLQMDQDEDKETFIGVLELLLRLGRIPAAEGFLDHIQAGDMDMLLQVAEVMKNLSLFDAAADFYQMVLEGARADSDTKAECAGVPGARPEEANAGVSNMQPILEENQGAQASQTQKERKKKEINAAEGLAYCMYRAGRREEARALYQQISREARMAAQVLQWMEA